MQHQEAIKLLLKNPNPTYYATIKQALNGYIVVVEEEVQSVDSETVPAIQEQIKEAMSGASAHSDPELDRILRANNMRPEKGEVKMKKVGVRVFTTYKEASAFLSSHIFIDDELKP